MDNEHFAKLIKIMGDGNVIYYDDPVNTMPMKIAKAIVPYLSYENQKQIGLAIKFFEIEKLMQMYAENPNPHKENDFEGALLNVMKIYIAQDKHKKNSLVKISNYKQSKKNIGDDIKMEDLFNDDVFKSLTPDNINLLKQFMRDIANKSPMEAVTIMMAYSSKMPKNLTDEQKKAIIDLLIKKMPSQKRQQFLTLYDMFGKDNMK